MVSENTTPPLLDAEGSASHADVSPREAVHSMRALESIGVLRGAGYFQREPRAQSVSKRKKKAEEHSADEYSE